MVTMSLRYSDDGGHAYSTPRTVTVDLMLNHKTRVMWRRLGASRDRVFEVSSISPVGHCWVDAFINHLGVQ